MKPDFDAFKTAVKKYRGNLTKVALAFGVDRSTVGNWTREDNAFKTVVSDARMRLFDDCLATSEILAMGVAERDEDGKFIDWKRTPDGNMLRYILSSLGKEEGFGERDDTNSNASDLPTEVNVRITYNQKSDLDLQTKFEKPSQ